VAALVDTSGLLALLDADDRHHVAVRSTVEALREPLVVPLLVLPEADYLVATRLGVRAEVALLEATVGGEVSVEAPTTQDLRRCLELIQQYADSDIGLVDASIVATAERLGITRLLTLDHRHFRMIRPRHCAAFDLLP
jgi:predicted nucleic acid-binding protein